MTYYAFLAQRAFRAFRYPTLAFLLIMVALPLKMLLRLLWHIKYVWITPWFNI